MDRAKLLTEILDGEVKVSDIEVYTNPYVPELRTTPACDVPSLLKVLKATELGAGVYGTVSKVPVGKYAFVLKESKFNDRNTESPHTTNNIEASVLKALNNNVLLQGKTPHLPLYAGSFRCKRAGKEASFIILEMLDGTLENFIETRRAFFVKNIKIFLF